MTGHDGTPGEDTTADETRRSSTACLPALVGRYLGGIRGIHLFWAFVVCLSLGFLWSAFSGPRGIFALLALNGKAHRIHEGNRTLLEANQALGKEIYLLRASPSFLQKVAREELGYIAEGETIYLPVRDVPAAEPGH